MINKEEEFPCLLLIDRGTSVIHVQIKLNEDDRTKRLHLVLTKMRSIEIKCAALLRCNVSETWESRVLVSCGGGIFLLFHGTVCSHL